MKTIENILETTQNYLDADISFVDDKNGLKLSMYAVFGVLKAPSMIGVMGIQ